MSNWLSIVTSAFISNYCLSVQTNYNQIVFPLQPVTCIKTLWYSLAKRGCHSYTNHWLSIGTYYFHTNNWFPIAVSYLFTCALFQRQNETWYQLTWIWTQYLLSIYRGYWMSVSLILNLLHDLNTIILCEPLASIISFYSTSSINSVINLNEFNILLITYPNSDRLKWKKSQFLLMNLWKNANI
jgi:hypothetical protein